MRNSFIFLQTLIFVLLLTKAGISQTPSNLDRLNQVADSSISLIKYTGTPYCLKFNTPGLYQVFTNTVTKAAGEKGFTICKGSEDSVISYTIENARIKYPLMFRDGFMGRYLVQRTATLEGSYYSLEGLKKFGITLTDTVAVDNLKDLENDALPFTKGELPSEPFFSGLLEPVVAISAAAAIIILYFTVRSK